jgi:hypothetical protein
MSLGESVVDLDPQIAHGALDGSGANSRHEQTILASIGCGGGREGTENAAAVKRGSLVSAVSHAGDRGFESVSLQRRVRLSRDFIFVGQEARLSARVCRAVFPAQSAETRGGPPTCANPRKYLSLAIFRYRISGDAVATSCRAKASRLSPNEIGLPLGSRMLADLASAGSLKQSRAHSADRANRAADGSARAASLLSGRAAGARRGSLG